MKEILRINEWQKGVAPSAHLGFADMRNCDITSTPGVVKINGEAVQGTATLDVVRWFAKNPNSNTYYALDDSGNVYSTAGSGWSRISNRNFASGAGMAVWKDALIVLNRTTGDAYYPLSNNPQWVGTTFLTGLNTNTYHTALAAQDDILYIANGTAVASLAEVTGTAFHPAIPSTFTLSTAALDLPDSTRTRALSELGQQLLIGDGASGKIYPWDRTSSSFNIPIDVNEKYVSAILTQNNTSYIIAGEEASIYVTDGTNSQFLARPPRDLFTTTGGTLDVEPGAFLIHNSIPHFGLSIKTSSFTEAAPGVWSVQPDGTLNLEYEISANERTNTTEDASALFSVSKTSLLIGWKDTSNNEGIDEVATKTKKYTSYSAYVRSPFYPIGSPNKPQALSTIEAIFEKPLATDEGVRLSYRTNLNDSFTTIDTLDAATYGTAVTSILTTFGATTSSGLQIQAELTTGSNSATTPELKEVIVR